MRSSIIEAKQVGKTYPDGKEALKNINLSIREGERFVLLGPNGAGKSTFVRILATLSPLTRGKVTVAGMDCAQSPRLVRSHIGVALQDVCLDPDATAMELLCFQARLFDLSHADALQRTKALVAGFQLGEHANKPIKTLSGGNKRRVHIALSLVHRPKVLFLDEPTVGMDPEGRVAFWNEIRRLNTENGVTVFLTTQYLEEADQHAEQMAIISNGALVFNGSVAEFKNMTMNAKAVSNREQSIQAVSGALSLEERYLHFIKQVKGEKQ
jgi:ABC-2 type transport system ATP-binding protein